MKVQNCRMEIRDGNELLSGHVEMNHGQEYVVFVDSGFSEPSDAIISIDDKEIGTWRIPANRSIGIERPGNADRKLTFFKSGTEDAHDSGESGIDIRSKGLVSVRIIPAYKAIPIQEHFDSGLMRSYGGGGQMKGCGGPTKGCAGVSGLGDYSSQKFGSAGSIERDYSRAVTISLRLVCHESHSHKPSPITDVRANPIPDVW